MSNYENIIPEDIASNTFEFHGASIRCVASSTDYYSKPYEFFSHKTYGSYIYGASTSNCSPPHCVGIESSRLLIVDRFDFTACVIEIDSSHKTMSVEDFKIESSIDGKTWSTLYTDYIGNYSSSYDKKCEFNPTRCKYIRCTILSTYWNINNVKSFEGRDFKIYGTLAGSFLYTNPDAYGIRKKE